MLPPRNATPANLDVIGRPVPNTKNRGPGPSLSEATMSPDLSTQNTRTPETPCDTGHA